MQKGNSGEASEVSFEAGALNCAIWLKYTFLIDDFSQISKFRDMATEGSPETSPPLPFRINPPTT